MNYVNIIGFFIALICAKVWYMIDSDDLFIVVFSGVMSGLMAFVALMHFNKIFKS